MLQSLSSLLAAGIIEKDDDGVVLWTWSYPTFSNDQKQFVLTKCCLTRHSYDDKKTLDLVPFVYSRHLNHWFYIFTSATGENSSLQNVAHISIVLASEDFNPEKYAVLSRILSRNYDVTGSSVPLLEQYLKVVTQGVCNSNDNGTFDVNDFSEEKAHAAASLKDVVNNFGIQSILLYVAVLLKKRVLVFHENVNLLLEFTRALPGLAWHRRDWSVLHPWLDSLEGVSGLPCFIAGTTNTELKSDEESYDVFVNVPMQTIEVAPHSKESLALGKLHKDIAKTMVELSQDDNATNEDLIEAIHSKTEDILTKLRSLGGDEDPTVSIEEIKSRNFNQITEKFLINLAAAERLIKS